MYLQIKSVYYCLCYCVYCFIVLNGRDKKGKENINSDIFSFVQLKKKTKEREKMLTLKS